MRTLRKVAPSVIQIGRRGADLIERGRAISSDLALLVTKFYAFDAEVPVELVDFSLEMINATPVDVLADFYPALVDHHVFDHLDSLNGTETLVVVGERDLLTPPITVEHWYAASPVPSSRFSIRVDTSSCSSDPTTSTHCSLTCSSGSPGDWATDAWHRETRSRSRR